MRKLGILGGMGPESTLLYYKEIASGFKKRDKNGYFPALTIETVNMYEMLDFCKTQQYEDSDCILLRFKDILSVPYNCESHVEKLAPL